MATITLYIGVECDEWETHIRNAIQELAGEEDVEVEVQGQRVVVEGCNASAEKIIGKLYHKLGLRFEVEEGLRATDDDDDDDDDDGDEDDDDNDDDDDDDGDEDDDDDDDDDDGDEDDDDDDDDDGDEDDDDDDDDDEGADDDDDTYVQMGSLSLYGMGLPATAIPEPSWEDQPVADPSPYFF